MNSFIKSKLKLLLKITVCIVVGILTTALVIALISVLFVMFVSPYAPEFLVLLLIPIPGGIGFFLGGVSSRYLAGTQILPKWIGVACTLTFIVIMVLLPDWSWTYDPHNGWVFDNPAEATITKGDMKKIWSITILMNLFALAVSLTMAWLGDKWATHRLEAKTTKVSD